MNKTIAAVVVTYNRKELLLECLNAIRTQSKVPDAIYIIDNRSTDGTPDLLKEKGYITRLPDFDSNINEVIENSIPSYNKPESPIQINYVRKSINDGGAGGFYEGMKQAFDAGYQWIWMMDDDGIPDQHQLETLINMAIQHQIFYSNALVINKDHHEQLAFRLSTFSMVNEVSNSDIVYGAVSNFNGTLIAHDVIKQIGFIKKEMFIWGDENEYTNRVRKAGFRIATFTKAIHYHPSIKASVEPVFPFLRRPTVVIKPENRASIFYRNLGYLEATYGSMRSRIMLFISYSCYYACRMKFQDMCKFIRSFIQGYRNQFGV